MATLFTQSCVYNTHVGSSGLSSFSVLDSSTCTTTQATGVPLITVATTSPSVSVSNFPTEFLVSNFPAQPQHMILDNFASTSSTTVNVFATTTIPGFLTATIGTTSTSSQQVLYGDWALANGVEIFILAVMMMAIVFRFFKRSPL